MIEVEMSSLRKQIRAKEDELSKLQEVNEDQATTIDDLNVSADLAKEVFVTNANTHVFT